MGATPVWEMDPPSTIHNLIRRGIQIEYDLTNENYNENISLLLL